MAHDIEQGRAASGHRSVHAEDEHTSNGEPQPHESRAPLQATTAERAAEERGRSTGDARFRALVGHAADIVSIVDARGVPSYISPGVERVLGYRPDEMLPLGLITFAHPDDAGLVLGLFAAVQHRSGHSDAAVVRFRHRDGSYRHLDATVTNLLDNTAVRGIVVNARDVTEQAAAVRALEQQALHDALTGLPNRVLFRDRLAHALDRAHRQPAQVAILFLDLDNFKVVNDSLGHPAGDALLLATARRLEECLRHGDTVARFGGDEFIVLLEDVRNVEEALGLARRLLVCVEGPVSILGREVQTTASIGVALHQGGDQGADDLLRDADTAMYRAKAAGRDRIAVFEPWMNVEALARLELEEELRRAISQQELRVVYQPIVELATGRVDRFEALVRWQHPARGLLLPDAFIPLAEETGLVLPLGQWVLAEACQQLRQWRAWFPDRPTLGLSVNLSVRQVQDPTLAELVGDVLSTTGLQAEDLQLEITESAVMPDQRVARTILRRLRDQGIRLALDDFGTGYSSLNYLRGFPTDVLKIARSFVTGMVREPRDAAIVAAIIDLGHALGMIVTAEGVRTKAQTQQLLAMGCDLGQGYDFARPLGAEAVPTFLARPGGAGAAGIIAVAPLAPSA